MTTHAELSTTAPVAGTKRGSPKDGLTYVWIPPGTFMMGCSPGDGECSFHEKPTHQVTITKGFWMGQTVVTQEAYQRVVGTNPSYFKGAKLPVETVGWNEAQSYCQAVEMRLPTEAEWEYAERAGTTASRYGDVNLIAWHKDNSGNQTHEVGQKQPNAWGLHDMLGNVEEWVADWFADEYLPGSVIDPRGPANSSARTLRGTGYGFSLGYTRASMRSLSNPTAKDRWISFRCAGD